MLLLLERAGQALHDRLAGRGGVRRDRAHTARRTRLGQGDQEGRAPAVNASRTRPGAGQAGWACGAATVPPVRGMTPAADPHPATCASCASCASCVTRNLPDGARRRLRRHRKQRGRRPARDMPARAENNSKRQIARLGLAAWGHLRRATQRTAHRRTPSWENRKSAEAGGRDAFPAWRRGQARSVRAGFRTLCTRGSRADWAAVELRDAIAQAGGRSRLSGSSARSGG